MSNYRRSTHGRLYFFTLVTHRRREILTTKLGRLALRSAIEETRAARPFSITAMVLLPDHLHALWELPEKETDYSTRWRQIKSLFTRRWLAEGGTSIFESASRNVRQERGVWQRRFFEHTIRDEQDLKRCVDYIHVNPLRHGLVNRVRDWEWSTFHRYVKEGEYSESWGGSNVWYGDEFARFE